MYKQYIFQGFQSILLCALDVLNIEEFMKDKQIVYNL